MKLQKDLKEFIELLNSMNAKYVLVGGHAVAFHGYPRFTGDTDFFIGSSRQNLEIVAEALKRFGFGTLAIEVTSASPGTVFQIGRPPHRIDLLTSIDGVAFDEAWDQREIAVFGDMKIPVVNKELLIRNKRATGRTKDAEDVRQLGGS